MVTQQPKLIEPRILRFEIRYSFPQIQNIFTMPSDLPDIASMKISELKEELNLYGIDSSDLCEKPEFTAAVKNARETLPRPTTTQREVEPPQPSEGAMRALEKEKHHKSRSSKKSSSSGSSSRRERSSGSGSSTPAPAPAPAALPPSSNAPQQSTSSNSNNNATDTKRLLAMRSPVTALQQLREHPSERLLGERNNSFLPGSPFLFALCGSLREDDAAMIRIPDGVCLQINTASIDRKAMEGYLAQKGSVGVSLKISTEENPQLMPIWTFDKEKSTSYSISNMGIRVCGPRKIRLLAFMEMGFRSGASVDVFVFGSVSLDKDKFY